MTGISSGPFSDEDVAHFESRGYVWLRGALGPASVIAWRDRITRLIRTDRSAVRELHPPEHADRLSAFDPSDPRTWSWSEIRMAPELESPVRELASCVHAATAQLVGGEDRIAPCEWNDQVVINLGQRRPWPRWLRAMQAVVPVRRGVWHTDDPRGQATIDSFRLGLVQFIALSDSMPLGGGTLFSPRSFPRVVRHVKNNPAGADLRNEAMRRLGGWFGEQMVARAGDVLLAHPFLLHCRGPNRSRIARYMAKRNVFLKEPLRFSRPDGGYSSVERAVARVV